jgi:hypothetical protein
LLRQVAEEAKTREEGLVLTDTAPLLISAETEYLARFVDCAIVVLESGVTTRAQLRAAANALQRLDAASVGFVLNRVGLKNADPAFRHSVRDLEKHLRAQNGAKSRRTVRSRHFEAESERAAAPSPAQTAVASQPESPAAEPVAAARDVTADVPQRTHRPATPAPLPPPTPKAPQAQPAAQPAPNRDAEIPWWLADAQPNSGARGAAAPAGPAMPREPEAAPAGLPPASTPEPMPRPAAARQRERASAAPGDLLRLAAQPEARQPEIEEAPQSAASRLSGLRGLLFSLGLKNLNEPRETEARTAPAAVPTPPPESAPEGPVVVRTFVPYPEPAPVSAVPSAARASGSSARRVTAQPEILPPRPRAQERIREHPWENEEAARRDRRDPYDEVEILPSWRGQYKKKE